jgi:putative glutamine amidotransferase
MSRPRILIPVPTSFDLPYNGKSWPEYAAAITAAGGDPIKVELTHAAAELEAMVAEADGVLLPGSGADVDPTRYGHERIPACADPDPLREGTDFALLEAAEQLKKPLLGICFGTQAMNVFHGGTLIQDLPPLPNHKAGRPVQVAHSAVIAGESRLGRILAGSGEGVVEGDELRLPVNSSHHQAVLAPGDGVRVVARCPEDAVIEAIEGGAPEHWLIGVQWHPERTYEGSAASRALFAAFIAAAGA